jgi:4-amino-4-deoxy-L-arabinose transferase-like glycosyltransferase
MRSDIPNAGVRFWIPPQKACAAVIPMVSLDKIASMESPSTAETPATPSRQRQQVKLAVLSGLVLCMLYTVHLECCQYSVLPFFDLVLNNYDMHANMEWANSIHEQGWLNPNPFHPYNDWMRAIAPYPQWVQWWGGEQIFQQSPLYAYLLALFPSLFLMRLFQALMSMATCVFLGLLTNRFAGRKAGWIAFWLAALYAPFFAYSWPFLRDGLGWLITAALIWSLMELTRVDWTSRRARQYAWVVGGLLGLGFLAKETYLLLIPAVLAILGVLAWKRRASGIILRAGMAAGLILTPLLVRNVCVKAPLLSSSNRFSEAFVEGNAGTTHPFIFTIPLETKQILYDAHGRAWPVIVSTIASHPDGIKGWLKLQGRKFLSLADPYESPDNLDYYFMADISPVVRFGLQYWMILVPGVAGMLLMIRRPGPGHFWLWVFLPPFLAAMMIGVPVSRYRQSLMIFLIPWAACFLALFVDLIRRREFRLAGVCAFALCLGWLLVLGPFAQQPRGHYYKPDTYIVAADLYRRLGDPQKSSEMTARLHQKFPDLANQKP